MIQDPFSTTKPDGSPNPCFIDPADFAALYPNYQAIIFAESRADVIEDRFKELQERSGSVKSLYGHDADVSHRAEKAFQSAWRESSTGILSKENRMTPTTNPTAESIFGPTPWQTDVGIFFNSTFYPYSKYYFATPEAAQKVADMLGGTVVEQQDLSVVRQSAIGVGVPRLLVLLHNNGLKVNAGTIMQVWTHGYPQSYIDTVVSQIVGFTWHYQAPVAPPPVLLQPSDGLMMAAIGEVAMQADGTVWKRVS